MTLPIRLAACALVLAGLLFVPLAGAEERPDGALAAPEPLGIHLIRLEALVHGRTSHFAEGGPLPGNDEWAGVPPLAGRSGEEPMLPLGSCDEIIELVKSAVRPEYWDETDRADTRSAGENTLVVRASDAVAREVAAFVAALDRYHARTLTVDVQQIQLTRGEVMALRAVPGADALDSKRVNALLAAGRGGPAVSVVTHPHNQVGVFGGVQRTWLGGADVEVAEGSAVGDPQVHAGHVGLSTTVGVAPIPGREAAVVTLSGTASRHRGDRLVRTAAGTLELPAFETVYMRSIVTVPTGRWSLVDGVGREGPEGAGGGAYFLVRVTPHPAPPVNAALALVSMPPAPAARESETGAYELAFFPVHALSHWMDYRDVWGTPLLPSHKPDWDGSLWGHSAVWAEEGIVDLLREMSTDELWEDPASIEVRNQVLWVRQTPDVLGAVDAWLAALRRYALWTLETTLQVVDLPADVAREIGTGGVLERERVALLKAALEAGKARRTAVGRVLSIQGSRNYVTAGRRVSYVRDYDVEIACRTALAKPVVGTYLEGLEAEVSGGLASDGRSLLLEVRMQALEATGPLRSVHVQDAGPLELPELSTFRVRTSCHAPLDRITVVGSWGENGRRRLLLVTPRIRR